MKGISKRTTKLGFNVLRLHFSADADKDPTTEKGKRWLEDAKKGMSDVRWRQEYEIEYDALSGTLVFPGFDESVHMVEPIRLDPNEWTTYQGADPHSRTEHAFVYLKVNRSGEMVIPWSYWPDGVNEERANNHESRLTVKDYGELLKIIEEDNSFNLKPWYRVMDVAAKNFNADEARSIFDAYRDEGFVFYPAKRNIGYVGYDAIAEALKPKPFTVGNEEKAKPTLTIFAGCGDNDELAYQLKTLRYREWKGNVADKDAPEEPEQRRRHLVDCLSYIVLSDPVLIDRSAPKATFQPIYPALGY